MKIEQTINKTAVFIPFYNEVLTIEEAIEDFQQVLRCIKIYT